MKNMMDSCCGEVVVSKATNSLIRVVVFVSFIGLLIIVNEVTVIPSTSSEESMPLSSSTTETTRAGTSTSSSLRNSNLSQVMNNNGRRHGSTPTYARVAKSYMASERRVPNGPDPIHNRRARKSKEPPGRV